MTNFCKSVKTGMDRVRTVKFKIQHVLESEWEKSSNNTGGLDLIWSIFGELVVWKVKSHP